VNWAWVDYIDLADGLVKRPFEASKRTAVSRAYYGAFNLSRRWLEENIGTIENRATHRRVWEAFKSSDRASDGTRAKWELVGEIGDALRSLRNQADYADSVPDLDRRALEALSSAERILALLPELELVD
jgi:hypothetical protein